MYKAALFDLDGTVTDSMNLSAQAFIHTLSKHLNREYTPEQIFAMFGPGEKEIFQRLDPSQALEMMQTFLEFYRCRHNQYVKVYPGVQPLLDSLRKHMPLVIITGKGKEPALITLNELGLTEYFDLVITGCCVNQHKPHPEGINRALSHLGVEPDQTFYLGDSPGDMETARRAGVAAWAALWGAHHPDLLLKQNPDRAFATPQDVWEEIKKYPE